MRIAGSVALVTGANRGIGEALSRALLDHGAARVYAAARRPGTITDPRFTPLLLDVTDQDSIADAAAVAQDADIVVNNAGIANVRPFLARGSLDQDRAVMETNFFGTWMVSREFAPILGRNGGGAFVNVLSAASWYTMPPALSYSASKAAQWSLTNALREELREQGTQVMAVHSGYVDTESSAWVDAPKITLEYFSEQTLRALQNDRAEVLIDDFTKATRDALSGDIEIAQHMGR